MYKQQTKHSKIWLIFLIGRAQGLVLVGKPALRAIQQILDLIRLHNIMLCLLDCYRKLLAAAASAWFRCASFTCSKNAFCAPSTTAS